MGRGGNKQLASNKSPSRSKLRQAPKRKIIQTKLYRAGDTDKVLNYGEAHLAFVEADRVKPEDREGRLQGLFCSIDIPDLSKWTLANNSAGSDYDSRPREFNYSGLEPYVYPADGWLSASCKFYSLQNKLNREDRLATEDELDFFKTDYWNKGILISKYIANKKEIHRDHVWRGGGEVLADPINITSKRNVSLKRILEYTDDYNLISMKNLFKKFN